MRAFPVTMPSGARYWTVVDEEFPPVPVADRWLLQRGSPRRREHPGGNQPHRGRRLPSHSLTMITRRPAPFLGVALTWPGLRVTQPQQQAAGQHRSRGPCRKYREARPRADRHAAQAGCRLDGQPGGHGRDLLQVPLPVRV